MKRSRRRVGGGSGGDIIVNLILLSSSILGVLAAVIIFYSSMGVTYDRKTGTASTLTSTGSGKITPFGLLKATCRKNTAASIGLLCLGLAFLLQLVDILRNPYPLDTSSWFWIEDPSISQAYANWAQVAAAVFFGAIAVYFTILQNRSQRLQKQNIKAIQHLDITLTGGSARLSYSGYSKESIKKAYDEGDFKGTIEKIRGALLERADELNEDELENYVDSALTLTGGSARLSLSRFSKESRSIKKAYKDGDVKGTIEKIRRALLKRANDLNKDQLKSYVDSAIEVMEDCDARRDMEKKMRQQSKRCC
jgi:hypothetical protein